MRIIALLLGLLISGAVEAATPVWIDTDPAIGAPWREVDDAFALVLAFHSPEIRIVGLSTTYGNAGLSRTTVVARNLVRRFGGGAGLEEGEVSPGAASARDGARETPATESLARALRRERLTYVALGPLTNLAAFLQLHPNLAQRIDRIIFIGGRSPNERLAFGPTGSWRIHDANVFKDPAAVATVMRSKIPILLTPIETSRQLELTGEEVRANDYLARHSGVWMWFWTRLVGEKGAPVFDLLAVLALVKPNALSGEERFASLDDSRDLIVHARAITGSRPVQFARQVRAGAKREVLRRLRVRAGDKS